MYSSNLSSSGHNSEFIRMALTIFTSEPFNLYTNLAERNGKLPHLFIRSKTATLVPKFAVEDLPLGRTAALVPEFAVKDLSDNPTNE